MDQGSYPHYLFGLLAIGNNISALGSFLAASEGLPPRRLHLMILTTSAACLAFLLLFMLTGKALLGFFGISVSSFEIAGGLLLGRVGLQMLAARSLRPASAAVADASLAAPPAALAGHHALLSEAVVPIGIPLTVGAGTFSAVVLFATAAARQGTSLQLLAAIVSLVVINAVVFRFASTVMQRVGPLGLLLFIRIMGLFTLAIGVEFVLHGLVTVYRGLAHPPF
jgi:multiple antibiotic resistance protein